MKKFTRLKITAILIFILISAMITTNAANMIDTNTNANINVIVNEIVSGLEYDSVYSFSDGLAKVVKDNKEGFINKNGELVIPLIYDTAGDFYNGLSVVRVGENWDESKWGLIDTTGQTVVPIKYDDILTYPWDNYSEGLIRVCLDGKWGFIDAAGNEVIPCTFDYVEDFFDGLAAFCIGDRFYDSESKWGFIDITGNEIIPCQYGLYQLPSNDGSGSRVGFQEGLAAVELDGKWGYIDKTGNIIVPFIYDYTNWFSEDFAVVCRGNKWGYIDKTGAEVIELKYDYVYDFCEGMAAVCKVYGNSVKYGFVDKTGREVVPLKYDELQYSFSHSGPGLSNITGCGFTDGLAAVSIGGYEGGGYIGKWGFVNKNGEEVIPLIYDYVDEISEGMIAVNIGANFVESFDWGLYAEGGKWGYIDTTGKEITLFVYDEAYEFDGDFAFVSTGVYPDSKYGYIDKTGKEVVPLEYDYAYSGYSPDDKLTVMTKDGKWSIFEMVFETPDDFIDATEVPTEDTTEEQTEEYTTEIQTEENTTEEQTEAKTESSKSSETIETLKVTESNNAKYDIYIILAGVGLIVFLGAILIILRILVKKKGI